MSHAFSKTEDNPLVVERKLSDKEKELANKERIGEKALDRKRFKQEHEAINAVLDALEPLEVEPRMRVLRSAAHFLGAGQSIF